MLKRLYAHNYRCLVNFEINFDALTLLMGPNGGGKSSLFDLLYNIRGLIIDQANVRELFPPEDLTAWLKTTEQSFELDVAGMGGLFSYKLIISHNIELRKQRIDLELLTFNGQPLVEFRSGEVKLHNDEHRPGPEYSFDWSVSALAHIVERKDNKKLIWFKRWVENLWIISLQPQLMTSESPKESPWLKRNGSNFASWYRYVSQEHQDKIIPLTKELSRCIPGFHSFRLKMAGEEHKILRVGFSSGQENEQPVWFDFARLSDGQRVLIVLYSLLFILKDMGQALFLDEPENFVALAEIQPWLMELQDICGDGFPQVMLISHHPELTDYFGPEYGIWLERDPLGPTRVKKLTPSLAEGLKLSEQIARGWAQ